jgi:hypothetical protein
VNQLSRSDLIRLSLFLAALAAVVILLITASDKKQVIDTMVTLLVLLSCTALGGLITNRILKADERREMEESFTRLLSNPQSRFHLGLLFGGNTELQEQGFARVVTNTAAVRVPKPSSSGDCYTDILFLGFDEGDVLRHGDLVERVATPSHKLRVLLLDPSSSLAEERGRTLKYKDYPHRLKSSLSSLEHYFDSLAVKPNYEIRLYNEIPSILSIGTEFNVWFAPLWNQGNIKNLPVCEVLRGPKSLLFNALSANFEAMWERAKTFSGGDARAKESDISSAKQGQV